MKPRRSRNKTILKNRKDVETIKITVARGHRGPFEIINFPVFVRLDFDITSFVMRRMP